MGTPPKVEYLENMFGIPRKNIFNSRNTSFVTDVMNATEGRGVDIVLNSLVGELLHASWDCVAKFGKMVEIGKRDILGYGTMKMQPFGGKSYFRRSGPSTGYAGQSGTVPTVSAIDFGC